MEYAQPARQHGGNPNVPDGKSRHLVTWPSATFRVNRNDAC
jgi:hypothetical protein